MRTSKKFNFGKYGNLKNAVKHWLETYPELRDCDKALTVRLRQFVLWKDRIKLEEIHNLPSQESIKRIRARFNQEWLYWSKDPAVLKKRGHEGQSAVKKDLWYSS